MAVTNRTETTFFEAFVPNGAPDSTIFLKAQDGDREALAALVSRKSYEFTATSSADENVTFDVPRAAVGMDTSGVSRCVVRARYYQLGATAAGMQFGEAWAMFADIAGTLTIVGASVAPVFATGTANTVGTWSVSTTNMRLTVDSGSGVTATHLVQVEVFKLA